MSMTIVFFGLKTSKRQHSNERRFSLSELTVIIPFRNERSRINSLLESLKNQPLLPGEILFIDDHSHDNTSSLISEMLGDCLQYQIIKLNKSENGKKQAIFKGVSMAKGEWILTLDADVEFASDFMEGVSKGASADLIVLPVKHEGRGLLYYLFSNDLILAQLTNLFATPISRPIMASGANLLFKREAYVHSTSKVHFQIASGDDQFLLKEIAESGGSVVMEFRNSHVSVNTPQTLREIIQQRARWIGKTAQVQDSLANTLLLSQSLFQLLFWVFSLIFILFGEVLHFEVLVLKFAIDQLILFPIYFTMNSVGVWCFLPLYNLIFIPYTFVLVLASKSGLTWKDRRIK